MSIRFSKNSEINLYPSSKLEKLEESNTVEFERLREKLNKLMGEVYDGEENDEILFVSQKLDKMMNRICGYNTYYKSKN